MATLHDPLINLLFDGGLQNTLPIIAEILLNAAMLLKRETHIGAAPYQRGNGRNGYANGFKTRNFQTDVGNLELAIRTLSERGIAIAARHRRPHRDLRNLGNRQAYLSPN